MTYTSVHGNTRSLTHWARPGIKFMSSWILVSFLTAEPWWELHAEKVFRKLVYLWLGLCTQDVGSLASGIPALESMGCLVGQVLVPKYQPLGELTQMNASWCVYHQCQCPHSEPKTPLHPWKTHQDQQVGLAQAPMESLLCPGSQWTWDSVCTLQEWNLCFFQTCGDPVNKPYWLSKPNALGAPLPSAGPPGCGDCVGLKIFTPVGKPLWYNEFY